MPDRRSRVGSATAALRDPVVGILLLAGFFDGISDNWVHAILLWTVAGALAVDDVRRVRGLVSPAQPPLLSQRGLTLDPAGRVLARFGVAAAALLFVWLAGSFERYTWPLTLAIVLPAGALVAIGWRGPLRARPAPGPLDTLGALAWGAVFVAAGLLELVSLLLQPSLRTSSSAHPTLSTLMDPILASHVGRSITLLVWLVIGWMLLGATTQSAPEEQTADAAAPEAGAG